MDDKFFFDWYQKQLKYLMYEESSLMFSFSQFVKRKKYDREWAQKVLDFAYRVIKTGLCEFYDTNPDNIKILTDCARNNPCSADGYVIWVTYELYVTRSGEEFLKGCGLNNKTEEFLPLLKEKLSLLFEEHGVGFDKSCFIPVQF